MATTMIPASSISATLSADLTYNPSIRRADRRDRPHAGTSLAAMATNNFVKWYITLKDFQNLTWNVRDMPHYDAAASHSDVSDTIFAFARSGNHVYAADPYAVGSFDATGAEYAEEGSGSGQGSGVVLTQEASGGCVKFANASLALTIPLQSDTPANGEDLGAGTEALVGNTTVTYDRVLLDESASGTIDASTRTEASSTTTTWGFGTAAAAQTSFAMTINWAPRRARPSRATTTPTSRRPTARPASTSRAWTTGAPTPSTCTRAA